MWDLRTLSSWIVHQMCCPALTHTQVNEINMTTIATTGRDHPSHLICGFQISSFLLCVSLSRDLCSTLLQNGQSGKDSHNGISIGYQCAQPTGLIRQSASITGISGSSGNRRLDSLHLYLHRISLPLSTTFPSITGVTPSSLCRVVQSLS